MLSWGGPKVCHSVRRRQPVVKESRNFRPHGTIDQMNDMLAELNEPQRQAVLTTNGPVLMLAGAGSGKTKAVTHRIAHLVAVQNVAPERILAVTFTNKAAAEMRGRVLTLLGKSPDNRWYLPFIGTFHSICVRLLRQDGEHIGLPRNFTIFDAADSQSAVKRAMRNLGVDPKKTTPSLIGNMISSAKNELVSAQGYKKIANGQAQDVVAKVYPEYQRILAEAGAIDFDDIIMLTVQMLSDEDLLRKYQEQFQYVMVDEYQDTNHAQYRLTKLLAAAHRNLCVVGDDWQGIYSWRGANFQNILDFEKDYPDATIIKLEQNYRSTKNILDGAHAVITKNTVRSDKKLWTDAGGGPGITVMGVHDEIHEGRYITERIQAAQRHGEYDLGDVAVLYRTNAQSRSLEEAFLRSNLPYKIVGGTRFYERKEVKDILAYARLIYQPDDIINFTRIVNVPARGLGATSMERFLAFRTQNDLPLLSALEEVGAVPGLQARAQVSLSSFGQLLSGLREDAERMEVAPLLERIIARSGYLDYLDDGSLQAEDRIENVKELLSVAGASTAADLGEFLEEIALVADIDSYDQTAPAVTLMTLHAAKGLEFPVVFIAGMEDGVFPHTRALFDHSQMEEERRLCYVGMTRAKKDLTLVHANSRLLYGTTTRNAPSRFVLDIPASVQSNPVLRQQVQPDYAAWDGIDDEPERELPSLGAGDRISHPAFGEGIVAAVDGDELTATFNGVGQKRLSLSFAPIQKLD